MLVNLYMFTGEETSEENLKGRLYKITHKNCKFEPSLSRSLVFIMQGIFSLGK